MSNRGVGTTRRTIPVGRPIERPGECGAAPGQVRWLAVRIQAQIGSDHICVITDYSVAWGSERVPPSTPLSIGPGLFRPTQDLRSGCNADSVFPIDRYARCAVPAR